MEDVNVSNTSDISLSIDILFQKYNEMKVKISNLYTEVDSIWQKLNLGRVYPLSSESEAVNMRKSALPEPSRQQTRAFDKILKEEEPAPPIPAPVEQIVQTEQPVTEPDVTAMADLNVTAALDVTAELSVTAPRDVMRELNVTGPREQRPGVKPMEQEIYFPNQKLETLKRTSEYEVSRIRQGYVLREAGLADMQPRPEAVEPPVSAAEPQIVAQTGSGDSESSETPLGRLDSTKVSLGNSVQTTDSQRFIRNQWGIEDTMIEILNSMKAGMSPITVETLVQESSSTSLLELKEHS